MAVNVDLSWLTWGTQPSMGATERRKLINLNMGAGTSAASTLVFAVLYGYSGNPAVMRSTIPTLVVCLISFIIPFLNKAGWYSFTRWFLPLSLTLGISTSLVISQGNYLLGHFYYLLFAFLPLIYYPPGHFLPVFSLFVLNIGLFLGAQYGMFPLDPVIFTLSSVSKLAFSMLISLSALGSLLLLVFYSEQAASNNEARLESLSSTDSLTGLLNRRGFRHQFLLLHGRMNHDGSTSALIMVDNDNFKAINDTYGHETGDNLLIEVGRRITQNIRTMDIAARYGGDEFVIVIAGLQGSPEEISANANHVAEKLRLALEAPYSLPRPRGVKDLPSSINCTASLGVVLFSSQSTLETVLAKADHAMFAAKQGGKNQVHL